MPQGACWVSKKCFPAPLAMVHFENVMKTLPNLKVFLHTSVLLASRDSLHSDTISSVLAVHRLPVDGTTGWEEPTSKQIEDWYDPAPSRLYRKEILNFSLSKGGMVVEATEFGDVLMTLATAASTAHVAQGIEVPLETSTTYLTSCGQGNTITFHIDYLHDPVPPNATAAVPAGESYGIPYKMQGMDVDKEWTYRRSIAAAGPHAPDTSPPARSVNEGGAAWMSRWLLATRA
jgi:hypothetical protein